MRQPFAPILTLLSVVFYVSTSVTKVLRIAAWNIKHLPDQNSEGSNPRLDTDYHRLAPYVVQMDADVIGLQEVEGASATFRMFPPD